MALIYFYVLKVKNHKEFYRQCVNAQKPPVNKDIFAPLPREWVDYFKDPENRRKALEVGAEIIEIVKK